MSSGLEVELWVQRLCNSQAALGRFKGPAFSTPMGEVACIKDFELAILDRLHMLQTRSPELIPADINVYEEYGLSRSFRWRQELEGWMTETWT